VIAATSNQEPRRWMGHLSPPAGRGRIALAIRVRGSLRKRGGDHFENSCRVAQHIIVPEAQDAVFVIEKPFVADHVTRIVRVLASIHLNDKTALTADQINNEGADRLLSDELVTVEPARSEPKPQSLLRIGRGCSEAPGAPGFDFVRMSQVETPLTRRALPADLSPHAGRG